MIPVKMFPPPGNYVEKVKRKGENFLKKNPAAGTDKIRNRNYWTEILPDLRVNYNEVCSYSAQWCGPASDSVDHYIPVSRLIAGNKRLKAYQWDNFRYSGRFINSCKGDSLDVVDPFQVKHGWFVMNFPSLDVLPGEKLVPSDLVKVKKTIEILKLNAYTLLRYRTVWLDEYVSYCRDSREVVPTAFKILKKKAPFLAYELARQQKQEEIIRIWKGIK